MKLKRLIVLASWLVGSILFGIVTKILDDVPILGDIFTRMGIWVLIATIIAAYSKTPVRAAVHTFLFFTGMLIGYYVYSAYLFGVYSTNDIRYWGAVAVITPFLGAVVWFAKNGRRFAYLLAALPMGLLLSLAISIGIFYLDLTYIEEFIMYLVLCMIFYKNSKQIAILIALSIVVASIIDLSPYYWIFI